MSRLELAEVFLKAQREGISAERLQLLVSVGLRGEEEVITRGMLCCVSGLTPNRVSRLGGDLQRKGLMDLSCGEWRLTSLGERVVRVLEGMDEEEAEGQEEGRAA